MILKDKRQTLEGVDIISSMTEVEGIYFKKKISHLCMVTLKTHPSSLSFFSSAFDVLCSISNVVNFSFLERVKTVKHIKSFVNILFS